MDVAHHTFSLRLQHSWAVLTGRVALPARIEDICAMTDLTKGQASIAALSAIVDRLLARNQALEGELATANATIAGYDQQIAQGADAIAESIAAALPPEAPADAQTGDTAAEGGAEAWAQAEGADAAVPAAGASALVAGS